MVGKKQDVKSSAASLGCGALITAFMATLPCAAVSLSDGFLAHLTLPKHLGISSMLREFLLVTVDD